MTVNVGTKVNRAFSATTAIAPNSYGIGSYTCDGIKSAYGTDPTAPYMSDGFGYTVAPELTRYFGPGQTVPGSLLIPVGWVDPNGSGTLQKAYASYILASGVEFTNVE